MIDVQVQMVGMNHLTVVPEGERDTDDENSDDELTPNYGVLR